MKKITKAYGVLNQRGGLLLDSERLPIYWNSKIARGNATEFGQKKRVANVEVKIIKIPQK